MFLCFLTDHVMTIVGISPVMIFTNHALGRIHSLWDPITQGWPHWSTRSAESGAASMFLMWFWNSRRLFFGEKTRLINYILTLIRLVMRFQCFQAISCTPHVAHPGPKKKGARLPAKSQNQRPCHSSPTDVLLCRWWSDSLMVSSRVVSHQITDWSACGGDKTRNALFCWFELAMLLHGDWIPIDSPWGQVKVVSTQSSWPWSCLNDPTII